MFFKKIWKVYKGIRFCTRKKPCRFVIVLLHVWVLTVSMSDGRISGDKFHHRGGGDSISSLSGDLCCINVML
jgi:hypothetical protein